jgi:hypothetical protein
MTAPFAAFPPMAPIAAPFAAPEALGWELCSCLACVCCWVCVAAGGVCAGGVCAGGVCASAAGTTAPESAIRRDITLAEYLIWPLLGRPRVSRCCNIYYMRPPGTPPNILTIFTMMPYMSCRCFLNRFHMLIGSDDPLNVSVGRLSPTNIRITCKRSVSFFPRIAINE